jgi:outer membrane protein assembly factor BamB
MPVPHARHVSGSSRRKASIVVAAVAALVVLVPHVLDGSVPASDPSVGHSGELVARTVPSSRPTESPVETPSRVGAPIAADPRSIPSPPRASSGSGGRFPGGLLIADRGNGRLLIVDDAGRVVWRFPVRGSLPRGQRFSADDAFIAPDGKTIVANDESHQVIDRIDISTRRVIWQYGRYDRAGSGRGELHTPDDAYPLADGDIVVADIRNCRILRIDPRRRVERQWGRTGRCKHHPPATFALPNGDTPMPDGGLLITEIHGSRVVRLGPDGRVRFDVHVPTAYPSDAQLAPDGTIVVVDYANPGAVMRLTSTGRVLWRWRPRRGPGRLDHPSLAIPLPDGTIALNDDLRDRVVVIDPRTNRIVWQYGHTDRPGRTSGRLSIPDGIDVVPPGVLIPA